SNHSHVVVISGRAIGDLKPLLALEKMPELWGSHGWEHLNTDNEYFRPEPEEKHVQAFDKAGEFVKKEGLPNHFEVKPLSVAFHWRGLPEEKVIHLKKVIL